jgi:8-hydroxy-5-deazaflavin:NADPH oxidoreductase
MKIAILGGTGKLGKALAFRLSATGHDVMIGSRTIAKAEEAANTVGHRVLGRSNTDASSWCDMAMIAVPYASHRELLHSLRDRLTAKIIIDATVPIDPSNIFQIRTETGKSAAEETADIVTGAHVYAAFHTISHRVLQNAGTSHDVLVAGPDACRTEVMNLIVSMRLRPIFAGSLQIASLLERMTVLLLSINKQNKVKESSFKVIGL